MSKKDNNGVTWNYETTGWQLSLPSPNPKLNVSSAIKHFEQGCIKFGQGDFSGAILDFSVAIRLDPQYVDAYCNRGASKERLDRHEEAIVDSNQAIRLDPKHAGAYYNRGASKERLDRHEEAIIDLDQAIRLDPKHADAYCNRGTNKFKLGRYKEAIVDFDQAIRLNAKDVKAYSNRGASKTELGLHKEAIADFDQAILLNPRAIEIYRNRGLIRSILYLHEDAITDFDQAILLDPTHALTYNSRGSDKDCLGLHQDAIADFDSAILLDAKNAAPYYNRGLMKAKLGRYEESIIDFDQAILLDPKMANAYAKRGASKAKLGGYKDAIIDLDQAILLDHKGADTYSNRGASKVALGRYEEAIIDFDQAILLDPQNVKAYIYRGNCKYALGNTKEAIVDFCLALPLSMGLHSSKEQYIQLTQVLKFRAVNDTCLQSIEQQQVWLAHPHTFNDTDDGTYLRKLFPENASILKLLESILAFSCFGIPKHSPLKAVKDLNFTAKQTQLMWAHYANNSQGICLHYTYCPEQAQLARQFTLDAIRYAETIALAENASLYDVIRNGFFTKFSAWNSENEYRFITIASDKAVRNQKTGACIGQLFSESDLGLTLCGIEFGINCSPEDAQKVKEAIQLRSNAEEIKYYQVISGTAENPMAWSTIEV